MICRSLGYASANVAARMGGILAPFIINPGDLPLLTYSVMASMMFVAVILTPLVPETKDLVMPETVAAQEITVTGEAVSSLHQKTLPSDSNSSNSEEEPHQDEAYHIKAKVGSTKNGQPGNHLQMHLLGDQSLQVEGNGEAHYINSKGSTDCEQNLNNLPV
ncbi:solute carrier family 22 member 21 [Elysia marginata]|uniref:Solute carrier family 22 member 21 n=1 Tax=Elysia marginata TaxID=1093978 RepID=A0AAV4EYN1_9GAST|nr:solute carrier family 22 member 21 [Elysia marginata]